MLKSFYSNEYIEAGCDEAGRGCLAGPVFAAAVIFPKNFRNEFLNDSKMLSQPQRDKMRIILLIDGNRFHPYPGILHHCIVKGDAKYLSIAAASILAKTHRDDFMRKLHDEFPMYDWLNNKGYPCKKHRQGLFVHGVSPYHRRSYNLFGQLTLDLS
jgi:ribonuclease HII